MPIFRIDNEALLRDMSIKNYVNNSPPNILKYEIISMLERNTFSRNWYIDKDYPLDMLADIFRPFLYNYLIILINFRGMEKNVLYENELETKLQRMYRNNPNFGRKMYKTTEIFGTIETKEVFNSNHINFYGKQIENEIFDKTWKIVPNRSTLLLRPISFMARIPTNEMINILTDASYNVYTAEPNIISNNNNNNRRRIRGRRDNLLVMSDTDIDNEPQNQTRPRIVTPILSPQISPVPSPSYSVSSSISVPTEIQPEENVDSNSESESRDSF
jgi:hypothetical protein